MGVGLFPRLILWVLTLAISIWYVYRYASKIEKDPSRSLVYSQRTEDLQRFSVPAGAADVKMTGRQKAVIWLFGLTFLMMIMGLVPWQSISSKWTFFESTTKWLTSIPVLGNLLGSDMVPMGDWYFGEITMLFLFMSIVIMFVYHMKENDYIDASLKECQNS